MELIRQETIVRDVFEYFCDFCNTQLKYDVECDWCNHHVCDRCSIEIDFRSANVCESAKQICLTCLSLDKERINDIQNKTTEITEKYLNDARKLQEIITTYQTQISSLSRELYSMCWDNYKKINHVWDNPPKINGISSDG